MRTFIAAGFRPRHAATRRATPRGNYRSTCQLMPRYFTHDRGAVTGSQQEEFYYFSLVLCSEDILYLLNG